MKSRFTLAVRILSVLAASLFSQFAIGQTGVLNPNDTIVVYNPSKPPTTPPSNTLAKWVKTNRLNWNTTEYKCYYYNGIAFRLKFPKSYTTANDGKLYPLYLFFHGVGEAGTIYDNEYQLFHGGQLHMNAVDNGTFDGFLLYPQSSSASGGWSQAQIDVMYSLITKYLIPQVKVDPNRVVVNGLSGGGSGGWLFLQSYPKLTACLVDMSASSISWMNQVNPVKFTPVWILQGGKDLAPDPSTTIQVVNAFNNAGAQLTYTVFSTLSHDTWDSTWLVPDYFPYLLRANKTNPWTLFGRTQFCPTDNINVTLGITAGYDNYQWRKNGTIIPNANSNTLQVTSIGTYDCQYLNGSTWSGWSVTPVVISIKGATIPPPIQVSGLASDVVPAPDGSTSVNLQVPPNYVSYVWERVDSSAILSSTTNILTGATPGSYAVKVTEQYGCSSSFSTPFTVINANGPNPPDAPISLLATPLSQTQVQLSWSENPAPQNLETQFEIYYATAAGGPYKLTGFSNARVDTFTVTGLNAKTTYYFKVRAINNTAASAATAPATATTNADVTPPTAPPNLRVVSVQPTYIQLAWDSATDNVGVTNYDIYINGHKSYSIGNQNSFTVYNLTDGASYAFALKARDLAGNVSPFSNQVIGSAAYNGLTYKYYVGTWSTLPDFNTLAAEDSDVINNVNLTVAQDPTDYAITWQGTLYAPVAGTYTFETSSDDGSKLYIDVPYSAGATATVNNDGLHGTTTKASSAKTLTKGPHTFFATYFQQGGGAAMSVLWKNPQTSNKFVAIPDSAFVEKVTIPGSAPNPPSALKATAVAYNKINLSWTSNSTNEVAFEIDRSTSNNGPFASVGRAPAHVTSFTDSSLQAATTYYYEVTAIGQYGTSKFAGQDTDFVSYNYYETGSLSALPNFATLTPTSSGVTTTLDLNIPNRGTQWAVSYNGYINITTAGKYTFYTNSDDGSALYIDGTQIVNNDGSHSAQEKSGVINNLSVGLHKLTVNYFQNGGGQSLIVSYAGPGITKQVIPSSVITRVQPNATTLSLPGAPKAPTNFAATALSPTKIQVSWTDSNTIATSYQLYRSSNNNTNYVLLKTLPIGNVNTVYIDSGLFSNALYYYKVRSVNLSGNSPYSSEASATTQDNLPTIAPIRSQTMHYGTRLQINVVATSPDNQQLSVVFTNLPAFATVQSTGNGTATLTFSPQQTDSGAYNNITVTATDQHSGVATTSFNLIVNDNYNPVITGLVNDTVAEASTSTYTLNATDQNGDNITWSFPNLPSFITPNPSGGTVALSLKPGYSDAGSYTIAALASDGRGGVDSETFVIVVTSVVSGGSTYINLNSGITKATGYWNNINKIPAQNDVYGPFNDSTGKATPVTFTVTTAWQAIGNGTNELGATTGNNSGVFPDVVMSSAFWTNTSPQTLKIKGLDTSANRYYNFTLFGSRGGVTDNRTTLYTVAGTTTSTATLSATANTKNTVTIKRMHANPDGTMTLTLQNGTGSVYGYLNAMVLQSFYDDGTAPRTPQNFAVTLSPNYTANLTWTPVAYNDSIYQVFRATSPGGPFTQIGTTGSNASSFTDSAILGNNTYYYEVNAVNSYGTSPFTPVQQLNVPNIPPVIAPVGTPSVRGGSTLTLPITVTFTAGDTVKLTAQNLPSFATLTDNGNGTGSISFSPTPQQLGSYSNLTVIATDNHGGVGNVTFNFLVRDPNLTYMYVDFNQTLPVGAPWNCFNSAPNAGGNIGNLKDDGSSNTGVSVTLTTAWQGASEVGMSTGNNSGVFPDSVMESTYFDNTSTVHHIKITGLSSANQYNLVFFASRVASDTRITYYSAGGQTVSLNASGNISNTVQINALSPDATGSIDVTVWKDAASPYAYINAMVIQAYVNTGLPVSPANLTAIATSRTSAKLSWSDRSSNETAFEIWRAGVIPGSTTLSSPLTKIDTVAANVTTYTDNSLTAASNYVYQVRAKAGTVFSDYSNQAFAATFTSVVYMNFNRDNPASSPWNNTNTAPYTGALFPNLLNDQGNPSGVNLTVVNDFDGDNPFGMNTGNNSGIFPDNVIDKTWWVGTGDTAKIEIDGLNQAMSYNFVFFASRNGGAGDKTDRTSVYDIGGNTASLNATNNISQTTQINNILPDSNGAVFIRVYNGTNSAFGYVGALIIQAANSFNSPVVTTRSRGNTLGETQELQSMDKIIAFPNPFHDNINLNLTLAKQADKLDVLVVDQTGRTVMVKQLSNVPQGTSSQIIEMPSVVRSGIYFIKVVGLPGEVKTFKVIKQ